MRTETTTRTLYRFAELSPEAQEVVIERERDRRAQDPDNWWAEYVIEDAETIGGLLGIAFRYDQIPLRNGKTRGEPRISWGLHTQGSGASFEGRYSYAKGAHRAIRKHAPQDTELHEIADTLRDCQRRYQYRIWADVTRHDHHYPHEHSVTIDVQRDAEVNELDGETVEQVTEALRDYMRWIYHQLDTAYEYELSDASIRESLEGNEEEFTETGEEA